jgi:hypothetical protein
LLRINVYWADAALLPLLFGVLQFLLEIELSKGNSLLVSVMGSFEVARDGLVNIELRLA